MTRLLISAGWVLTEVVGALAVVLAVWAVLMVTP